MIAHRLPDVPWTLFDDIHFSHRSDGTLSLLSPLIPQTEGIILSDEVEILPDQRQFHLLGRKDRVVKIAEQRVSLNDIEQRLCGLALVSEACTLTLEKQGRVCVAAVLVLTAAGEEQRRELGHNPFIGTLRQPANLLSTVSIPRYWRLVRLSLLPTGNGAANTENVFMRMPEVLTAKNATQPELHAALSRFILVPWTFPSSPILPGVTQVNWVMDYASAFLGLDKVFYGMDVVKFQRPLLPGEIVNVQIDWLKEKHRLVFRYSLGDAVASSGKIILCP